MAVLVGDILDAAARWARDPNHLRLKDENLLDAYNCSIAELCAELWLLEADASFDIVAGEERYTYPDDCIQVAGVKYSRTPADRNSFIWLRQRMKDEARRETDRIYPAGEVTRYFPRQNWFELIAQPTESIAGGGIINYWRMAASLSTQDNYRNATCELPDFMKDLITTMMVPKCCKVLRDYQAENIEQKRADDQLAMMRSRLEDRSDDRREAIRPPGHLNPYGGMS